LAGANLADIAPLAGGGPAEMIPRVCSAARTPDARFSFHKVPPAGRLEIIFGSAIEREGIKQYKNGELRRY